MFGSNVLEVAIGVVFVYLLMSLICSTINEQVIARFFALRSKTLEDGIKTMLNGPQGTGMTQEFYNHSLIQGLAKQGVFDTLRRKISKPSYISSRTFALTIQDIVAGMNSNAIPPALKTILDQAKGDAQYELASIEKWFDDTMDRVSGWYKRKVQLIIFILALIITVYLNVDTIALINNLSNNAVLRASIVSAAQGTDKSILDPNTNLKQLQTNFQQIQPAPGWTTPPVTASDWILKIVGLLATSFAVSLGAPFWFDTLSKIMQFRATGNPPPPSPLSPLSFPSIVASAPSNQSVENITLLTTDHYLNLKDGVFDATTKANLDHLFATLVASDSERLVVHFHGGLVDTASGKANAEHLMEYYQDLNAYQVFFLWESGLLDVLTQELSTIFEEPLFQQLLPLITGLAANLPHDRGLQEDEKAQLRGTLRASSIWQAGTQVVASRPNIEEVIEVLQRVTNRFAAQRDHGLYATTVEEVLRQFYLDRVGKDVWDRMKQATSGAFGNDPNRYGGTAFLKGLADYWAGGHHPHITLVGHSAGAIYICHFLQKALELLPKEVKFDLVFLAPACTFELFSETLLTCQQHIAGIRIFGMRDALEQADPLVPSVPLVYPYSLLYFVSGVLEDEPDTPLLGMQRYHSGKAPYDTMPAVSNSLHYLNGLGTQSTVWSVVNTGDGLASSATTHGGFYNDVPTLESLRYIISKGL